MDRRAFIGSLTGVIAGCVVLKEPTMIEDSSDAGRNLQIIASPGTYPKPGG